MLERHQPLAREFTKALLAHAAEKAHSAAEPREAILLIAACGRPGKRFTRLGGTATVTGVGFYDVKHGQTGVAPNGTSAAAR